MKMIWHDNEGDELALPFNAKVLAFFKKSLASGLLPKDRNAIAHVAGYKMQSSGEIAVGPFASHGEVVTLSKGAW
jgi:hypothetical protein